jgi:hypothetical protein
VTALVGPNGAGKCTMLNLAVDLSTPRPASRFWPFQSIEEGWLLALTALLIVGTVWVGRRAVCRP